jgi:hypothetical protein
VSCSARLSTLAKQVAGAAHELLEVFENEAVWRQTLLMLARSLRRMLRAGGSVVEVHFGGPEIGRA